MGAAIGGILPTAVGVALSPLPIVAVVLMLVSPRGRLNGPTFVIGWLAGLGALGTVVLVVASGVGASDHGAPAAWVRALQVILGALLLLLAVTRWRGRPGEQERAAAPRWMGRLEAVTPVKALAAGALLSTLNPKNLLLTIAAASAIAQAGISIGQQAVAYAVVVVIGTAGVGAPVVLALVLGSRSRPALDGLKAWLVRHNAAIVAVLLLVIGAKLIGDGIAG
jgi:Na+/melibiose symporter-like transporter